ncbi:molybdenum cofactor cytidylyltransferase [Lewinella marina]|uniref:MobA-like NTP transferase domain-containing protein n=1 Tax=Neolewinella marina TaxID=438751 RepID=A0A2G0CID6_9BACT|nr:nucleotidyltransferase family protein [Neolewinella marina]NJB85120.1 molybdenum cofactor cytidylyltransferase [Neolewinella marina]PHK99743.1 hypothetical protein CGL56_01455 [Neolewinella marina]
MLTAIVILAAGEGRRMGSIKQLLPWGQTTLLAHTVRQAVACPESYTYVVLGANKELLEKELEGLNVNLIYNADYPEGLGSSIRAAARHILTEETIPFTHLLVMLADQPAVNTSFLSLLLLTAKDHPGAVATDYGDHAGVPAIFPAASFAALEQLGGDAGAGRLLNAAETGTLRLTPPFAMFDIDTPEDYRRHEGNS